MKDEDKTINKHLLMVASSNLQLAGDQLRRGSWPPDVAGIGSSIDTVRLALQQTINCLLHVLEDL